MNLNEITVEELSKLDKPNTFVIVPLASCEQHGPHLPLGTKNYLSETIAYAAANRLQKEDYSCIIAPTFPYMPCQSSSGFPGTFSLSARTYSDALFEIGNSFAKEGFNCVFFVNLSISPDALKAISVAIDDLNTIKGFRAFDPMPLWNFSKDDKLEAFFNSINVDSKNEVHGDIKETSALLSLDPGLIREDISKSLPDCTVNTKWELLKGNISFKEMGSNKGYLGSPSKSSIELGQLYIEQAVNALSESMKYVSRGNELPDLPLQIKMLLKMVDLDEM